MVKLFSDIKCSLKSRLAKQFSEQFSAVPCNVTVFWTLASWFGYISLNMVCGQVFTVVLVNTLFDATELSVPGSVNSSKSVKNIFCAPLMVSQRSSGGQENERLQPTKHTAHHNRRWKYQPTKYFQHGPRCKIYSLHVMMLVQCAWPCKVAAFSTRSPSVGNACLSEVGQYFQHFNSNLYFMGNPKSVAQTRVHEHSAHLTNFGTCVKQALSFSAADLLLAFDLPQCAGSYSNRSKIFFCSQVSSQRR